MAARRTHAMCLASAAPFSDADVVAMVAFLVNMVVGPISLVILATCIVLRLGWRRFLAAIAALNLLIATVSIVTDTGGLAEFLALVWLQAGISLAVLVAGARPRWRAALFGPDRASAARL